MKCPNCGAEVLGQSCEFCGSKISSEMLKEQEQLNKQCCSKCGSTNISFRRENQGEVRTKNTKAIVHRTVGVCKDCGNTWYIDTPTPRKRKTWLWVLGWIFIFPIPLTILMLRNKKMKTGIKIGIIAGGWLLYLLIGFSGGAKDTEMPANTTDRAIVSPSSQDESKSTNNITDLSFLRGDDIIVKIGQTETSGYLKVKVKSNKDFSPDDILFISDNPEVATIEFSRDALTTTLYYGIKGVGPGETTVYATSKDGSIVSEKIKVTVPAPIEVEEINIQSDKAELILGESILLTLSISPDNAEDKSITWSSSDDTIAKVDKDGKVSALGSGTATITAVSVNGISSSTDIIVDASKRLFNLRVAHIRQDDNNIGDEWSYLTQINGERTTRSMVISAGEVLSCWAQITESDDNPDIGEASTTHTVTEEDLANGFEISMDVYVTENGGRNSGKSAFFVVTYSFSPN